MQFFSVKMKIGAAVLLAAATLAVGCSGLVSLDLLPSREAAPEKEWTTLGKNMQRQHFSTQNISPPLDIVWKKNVKSVIVDHPLAVGDYIFAPTKSGLLYMIDYETGTGIGSGKLGPSMAHAPSIHENIMYAGMSLGDKTLVGFDLRRANQNMAEPYPHIYTSPLIWENNIYFGANNGVFFCVDKVSGDPVWRHEARGPIFSSPSMSNQRIVFGDNKGWLYAVEAENGTMMWEQQIPGNLFSHPVLDDSTVYIGSTDGQFSALNLDDGSVRWSYDSNGAIYSSPALYQNVLYFGNNGNQVIALHKKTGDEIWRFETRGVVNTVPLPSPDYLYVTSWDRYLYVLNRFSGKLIFKFRLKRPAKSSPIIYRDYLLIHSANDQLLALANEKIISEMRDNDK